MATVVSNTGLKIISHQLKGDGTYTEPKYIAWGTGTTAAAASDTALETESAESRTAGTSSIVTTDATEDTYQVTGSITSLSSQNISEAALLTASASGSLFLRAVFTGIPLAADDSITFTFKSKFAAA